MTIIHLCCICGDDAEDKPNDAGDFLCMDHMEDWRQSLKEMCEFNETKPIETDEHGRNVAAMRRARAL
ncbi:hypothetical protein [Pseudorhodoplanes sinuspersici]|uniref:Uncharacterized protein n=1 Tax=Pseudorhodoplanes sinuspersici TaxID=1235591 RepID=A0A1W6ZXQ6_9HYPH|nr:hypothetical protein [Pseudorhodoplanes sinuspersici]ARQ01921.1 hypothetical protein CAK95_24585 [Pseudorhodoplanes sinuspersici]RKE73692.1 hypothetical protein DFP91_1587 [Pseudorhodoplanes sinuspersici]